MGNESNGAHRRRVRGNLLLMSVLILILSMRILWTFIAIYRREDKKRSDTYICQL
jgi:hypothetical protein